MASMFRRRMAVPLVMSRRLPFRCMISVLLLVLLPMPPTARAFLAEVAARPVRPPLI